MICRYNRLRKEILDKSNADPQTLPYLSAVIKEGLRIAKANPTRMPRIVGPGGLHVDGAPFIPAGARVGACTMRLHFNPEVFPNPDSFEPERWLQATEEMQRDSIPFGLGPRQCIARNLATAELLCAVRAIVEKDLLRGATPVREKIEIVEWFNSRVKPDGKIEVAWHV